MTLRILHIAVAVVLTLACSRQEEALNPLQPETIRVYDTPEVATVTDLTSADGTVLITYLNENNQYFFKLVTNEGDEIWTYDSGLEFQFAQNLFRVNGILATSEGDFDIIYGLDLLKISAGGVLQQYQPGFFNGLTDSYRINHVTYNADGNYLLAGTASLGGNRAFVAAYDAGGVELYKRFYFISVQGTQTYTSSAQLSDNSLILAGTFESPGPGFENSYFVSKLSPEGELLWSQNYGVSPYSEVEAGLSLLEVGPMGRDLVKVGNDQYLYLINPRGKGYPEQRLTLVRFDVNGTELGAHSYVDFGAVNSTPGGAPYTGNVLTSLKEEKITGIANPYYPNIQETLFYATTISYNNPQYTYLFELNGSGQVLEAEYVNRNFSNYLTSLTELSNGKTAMAGTIHSLGEELKLMVIIR